MRKLHQSSKAGRGNWQEMPKAAPSKQPALQSKDEARAKKVYTIARKDFVTLADFIASYNKPPVQVPAALLTLLNRAIALRKRHARWYSHDLSDENLKSNATHDYFVGVLEKVRDTLKPRGDSQIPIPPAEIQDDYAAASNLFDSLKIEEPSGGLSSAPTPTETLQDERHESEEQFVAEEVKTAQERYLAAYCLFRDIAKIREFVGKIWSVGAFDLMNCAVATNTAINLVRQAQRDFEKEFGIALDYKEVAGRFYAAQCQFGTAETRLSRRPDQLRSCWHCQPCNVPGLHTLGLFQECTQRQSHPYK